MALNSSVVRMEIFILCVCGLFGLCEEVRDGGDDWNEQVVKSLWHSYTVFAYSAYEDPASIRSYHMENSYVAVFRAAKICKAIYVRQIHADLKYP